MLSVQAESLLTQHVAQSGLSKNDVALAQWSVYTKIHRDHPLSFSLFTNLLDKLIKPMQLKEVYEEDQRIFWEGAKNLFPSCFNIIRKLRKKTLNEKITMKQVLDILKVISKIVNLNPPENFNLFPFNDYKWFPDKKDGPHSDILGVLNSAIVQGANDWFNYILETNNCIEDSNEGKLRQLIKIIQLVRIDLQKAVEYYDKSFQE